MLSWSRSFPVVAVATQTESEQAVRVWNCSSDRCVKLQLDEAVGALEWSGCGKYLCVGSKDSDSLRVFSVDESVLLQRVADIVSTT